MTTGEKASDRQRRRAAIYQKRARQLCRRKAAVFSLLIVLLAGLVGIRMLGTRTKSPAASSAAALALALDYPMEAQDVEDISAQTPGTELLAQEVPAEPQTMYYTPAVDVIPSADAAFFFDGYQVRVTEDTVFLPPLSDKTRQFAAADAPQGAADTYEEEVLSDEDVFLDSASAVLIDLDTGEVVCARDADALIYPASMTKILTLLVASEQITDRSATFTITEDITDLTFSESLSSVFWQVGETVTVADLEYGTILPSGADAAIGLARLAAGSEEEMVGLMNDRIRQMGLSEGAHFSNVTGMHAEDNLCTVIDMAMILKAAVEEAHVLDVLQTREYTATETPEHPNGVYMFNLFLDRTDLRTELAGTIVCAKTGYTQEALNCAASYFISDSGKHYVCVTALGRGSRRVVQDHVNLYDAYAR